MHQSYKPAKLVPVSKIVENTGYNIDRILLHHSTTRLLFLHFRISVSDRMAVWLLRPTFLGFPQKVRSFTPQIAVDLVHGPEQISVPSGWAKHGNVLHVHICPVHYLSHDRPLNLAAFMWLSPILIISLSKIKHICVFQLLSKYIQIKAL